METRDIGAHREFNTQSRVPRDTLIVERQSLADLSGSHSHNRVEVRIVSWIPLEDFDPDRSLFQILATRESLLHRVAQE
ncbi:hypothetical protein [Tunturibacter empetritectus]|uniref:Uncharacterized protein n=1 Tax=Tunturiibacter lichenicola TaxID=2051959 RepID=A0A7W8J699_9BACT|nr:hypothetical protein [Edaphobacter lichenicola]MBB5342306.1 hypothetical protein [Edaphobacter lichenicola]